MWPAVIVPYSYILNNISLCFLKHSRKDIGYYNVISTLTSDNRNTKIEQNVSELLVNRFHVYHRMLYYLSNSKDARSD